VGSEVYNAVIPAVATETVSNVLSPTADAIHPFANNTSITSITFEDGVSIEDSNASCLFFGCTNLRTITNVPAISGSAQSMCYKCSSLEEYPTFADFNATNLTNAFRGCTNMVAVNLELPQTVTTLTNAFRECRSLVSVGSMASNASAGNSVYHSCTNLTSVGDVYYTGTMGYDTFNSCTSLKSVGKIYGVKLAKILRMFVDCSALEGEICFESAVITDCTGAFDRVDLTKVIIKVPADSATYTTITTAYPDANVVTY
jgi:hypothetical protein